jgi:hypothetical protein
VAIVVVTELVAPLTTITPVAFVSCVSTNDCEAVGFSYNRRVSTSDLTLAEKWNGHKWTVQATPNP